MIYVILRFLALVFAKILFRLEASGRNNIPGTGGFILASNHVSFLDPVLIGVASSRRLSYMTRHDLFSVPVFGWILRVVQAFPLRRDSNDISSVKEAIRRLRRAGGLLIFPEGRRSLDGTIQKSKSGIGFLAARSRVPVIPVFISGTQRALGRNARFIRPAKVRIYFAEPIYYDSPASKDNYENFTERIIQEINLLSKKRRIEYHVRGESA